MSAAFTPTAQGLLLSGKILICLTGTAVLGYAFFDKFHSAYTGHFFDKVTFLVNCL